MPDKILIHRFGIPLPGCIGKSQYRQKQPPNLAIGLLIFDQSLGHSENPANRILFPGLAQ